MYIVESFLCGYFFFLSFTTGRDEQIEEKSKEISKKSPITLGLHPNVERSEEKIALVPCKRGEHKNDDRKAN